MNTDPAFHPHIPDVNPDAALAPDYPAAEAMRDGRVGTSAPVTPLPIVPCPPEFDPCEQREYAGVAAKHLAWAAPELLRQKFDIGIGALHQGLRNFTIKMRNALFMYSRVKRAMRWLETPQEVSLYIDDLHIDDLPPRKTACPKPVAPISTPAFTWAVTPKDVYQWDACQRRYGFDVRGTSLVWIERRVRSARIKAHRKAVQEFREREGISTGSGDIRAPIAKNEPRPIKTRTFKPASAQFGEIWPPVPVPDMAEAPVTVTPDYASKREAAIKSNPDEAVIGVLFIEDDSTRGTLRNDQTWWQLVGHYDHTARGLVYNPDARRHLPSIDLKPP